LAAILHPPQIIPAVIEFVDIAGLVKGASQGEGLGNRFLSHIREVDAIIQVVRCFEDPDVTHVVGTLDPVQDIETVTTELLLADLDSVKRRLDKASKDAKRGDPSALTEESLLKKVESHLDAGQPANTLELSPDESALAKSFLLLTAKPTLIAANVNEEKLGHADTLPLVAQVRDYVRSHHDCQTVVVSAKIEEDLIDLSPVEAKEFLQDLGVAESGASSLIQAAYHLLGLRTFFTANEKELRAWTLRAGTTAQKAAGMIHTDFERGFIKAETVSCQDLARCGSVAHAREEGLYRMEGKEYQVQDGDMILFRFHV